METKANFILIGAFTTAGFLALLGFLMWFAKLQLDRTYDRYDVYFTEVSGLAVSSEVRFAGLNVGTVVDMRLAPDSDGPVRVRLEVAEGTPIRVTSRASIESLGVTGVSYVSITSGNTATPLLREQSDQSIPVIRSTRSALQTLAEQGPEIIERLNTVADQLTRLLGDENQTRVSNILGNVERASGNLDRAMADVSSATDAIGEAAEGISAFGKTLDRLSGTADTALVDFSKAAQTADGTFATATQTLEAVRGYVNSDLTDLTRRLDETAATLQTDLSQLAARAETSFDALDRTLNAGTGAFEAAQEIFGTDLGPIIADLRVTLTSVSEAIGSVSDRLPGIVDQVGNAADSAASAFASLRDLLDGARQPVQAFATEALPQFSRLSVELRGLVGNVNQFVDALKRNPAQILTGPRVPEFRR
ncbi:MlaD family protein [Paracoccus marinaquae]|uniref:MCE family protein n=1 Tax=Paracoccus marinaquae TaxID=2841926 RepID=A0ABS6AE84_9RHOB|nr:MlaD family protein [Paracoccus marinaquae]MBU3028903.1 MCE family protein [Paracoccus marinaquae]